MPDKFTIKSSLVKHIEDLANLHGITIEYRTSTNGRAWRRDSLISIAPVKSEITYAIALHELGHCIGPWQSRQRLYKEACAWKWARDNALYWSNAMQQTLYDSLNSYYWWAVHRQNGNRPVVIPDVDHEFWDIFLNP